MWAYKTIGAIVRIYHIPLTIISIFTTLVSGIIAAIPLVNLVYILALSLVWQVILWPLIFGSWLWLKLPAILSWPLSLVFIPLALIGDIFLKITGALSADPEDRIGHWVKQSLCQQWPYVCITTPDGVPLVTVIQDEMGVGYTRAVLEFADSVTRRQLGLA